MSASAFTFASATGMGGRVPFQAARWSRRSFLGTLTALTVGVASGCGMGGADQQDFGSGGGFGGAGGRGVGADPAGLTYKPVTPYTLNATSVLSEDYFPVSYHQIDPTKDTVIAYSRADQPVEAILLQDGAVSQLYRDSTKAGGWNIHPLPDAADVSSVVAGMSIPYGAPADTQAVLKVFYTKKGDSHLSIAVEQPGRDGQAPTFTTTSVDWDQNAGNLQISQNSDGSVLVGAMVNSSSAQHTDARFFYYTDGPQSADGTPYGPRPGPVTGSLHGFTYSPDKDTEAGLAADGLHITWAAVIAPLPAKNFGGAINALMLYVPGAAADTDDLQVWFHPMFDPRLYQVAERYPLTTTTPGADSVVVSVESAELLGGTTQPGGFWEPTIVVRVADRGDGHQWLWTATTGGLDVEQAHGNVTWSGLLDATEAKAHGSAASLRPKPDGATATATSYLDVFVVADTTLGVMRQYPSQKADTFADRFFPLYTSMLPLQPGVAAVTSRVGSLDGDELLLIGTDGTLQTLSKDQQTLVWTHQSVQLPAASGVDLQQVSAYRAELSLVDFWTTPVPSADLQISATSPVTALVDGRTYALSDAPTTIPTDEHGQVVVVLVADGLSTPSLTVTASGLAATTVNPSDPVNTYMKGGTSLNYNPPLSTDTLTSATVGDERVIDPGAAPHDVTDAVTQMNAAAKQVPALPAAGVKAVRATTVGRPGKSMTVTLPRPKPRLAGGRPAARHHGGGTDVLSGVHIDALAHDILHGIKTSAVAVATVAVDVAVTITTAAKAVVQFTIHTVEDAAHVFHAALVKIGATIVKAVKWVEAEVVGLLKASHQLALLYHEWLDDYAGFLGAHLSEGGAAIHQWFDSVRADLHQHFTQVAGGFSDTATLNNLAANPPALPPHLQAARRPRHADPVRDDDTGMPADPSQPHSNWLFHKVKSWVSIDIRAAENYDLETALQKVVNNHKNAGIPAIAKVAEEIVKVVTDPKKFAELKVATLLAWVGELLDDVLAFVENMVDDLVAAFALAAGSVKDILDTTLGDAGLFGKILDLAGVGQIKFGTIICWLFAFPACLAYRVVNNGNGRPFPDANPSTKLTANETTPPSPPPTPTPAFVEGLKISAGSALAVWASFDSVSALDTFNGGTPGKLFSLIDIASPIVVAFLTVPPGSGGYKSGVPYYSVPADTGDRLNFAAWALGAVPALGLAADLYMEKYPNVSPLVPTWRRLVPVLTTTCGVGSMVTGLVGTSQTGGTGFDYAGAVLNNVANMMALCLTKEATDATEDISAGVDAAATLVCGFIGAAFVGTEP